VFFFFFFFHVNAHCLRLVTLLLIKILPVVLLNEHSLEHFLTLKRHPSAVSIVILIVI